MNIVIVIIINGSSSSNASYIIILRYDDYDHETSNSEYDNQYYFHYQR